MTPQVKLNIQTITLSPGFNDYLKELHTRVRNSYLVSKQAGKADGDSSDMRTTQLRFKGTRIQSQFLILMEKSIFYAKITVSQKYFISKLSFKYSILVGLLFS